MGAIKVIQINESVFAENDRAADMIRTQMSRQKTLFLNFMSAPGSGKTTTLVTLINRLKDEMRIGVMDVDIESTEDARRVADLTGIPALQIHNGGLCHIDADMVSRALFGEAGEGLSNFRMEPEQEVCKTDYHTGTPGKNKAGEAYAYDWRSLDLLILENIGNLVCPAEFDTGAHKNVMILSVPEGDDKPLKYPLMFTVSDVVLINKIDTLAYFDFNLNLAEERIHRLNPDALILPVSARTGEGFDALEAWVRETRGRVPCLPLCL